MDATFDPAGGTAAKRTGMARAARACNPEWWAFMLAACAEVARRKPFFNTDDMERIRQDRQGPRTHENRALGPLMHAAQKLGICEPTDDWVEFAQHDNHRRPMRVWLADLSRAADAQAAAPQNPRPTAIRHAGHRDRRRRRRDQGSAAMIAPWASSR